MPVRGGDKLRRNMRRITHEIADDLTPTVVKEILIIGEGYAAHLTPVDTSSLINSGFRTVTNTATGAVGVVGYTAEYALFVHEASGKLKGEPRASGKGDYWDPAGEPQFLKKGFEVHGRQEIEAHIVRRYRK